jgi:hypothetical protein
MCGDETGHGRTMGIFIHTAVASSRHQVCSGYEISSEIRMRLDASID